MKIQIGISTSVCFWNPKKVFQIAEKFGIGVEIIPLLFHTPAYIKILHASFPSVPLLGIHASFYKSYRCYFKEEFLRAGFLQKIYGLTLLLLIGTVGNNSGRKIAEIFSCYLNFHPQNFLPGFANSVIENPASHEPCDLSLSEIKQMADSRSCRATLDTSHCADCGNDILEAFRILNPYVIHFSDSRRGKHDHSVPGEGDLPLADLLKAIIGRGEDAIIIIELSPFGEVETKIKKSLRFLKKHL